MRLTLGARTFDLATRALVVGVAGSPDDAERQAAEGADVIELPAGCSSDDVSRVPVPVAVRTDDPALAAAAYGAGAVLGLVVHARATVVVADDVRHATIAETRSCLVDLARRAEAAGVTPDRIVLEPTLDLRGLRHVQRIAELGYPVLVSTTAEAVERLGVAGDERALALAATTLAIGGGARLIRTDDVRGARRVADVMAAVLGAR